MKAPFPASGAARDSFAASRAGKGAFTATSPATTTVRRVHGKGKPHAVSLRAVGFALLGVTVLLNVVSMAVPALIDHPLTGRGPVSTT